MMTSSVFHLCLCVQYDDWTMHDKKLLGYIKTKTTPHIYYLPVAHTSRTQILLTQSNQMAEGEVERDYNITLVLMSTPGCLWQPGVGVH